MSRIKGIALLVLLGISVPLMSQTVRPQNLVLFDYQQFHFGYSIGINSCGLTVKTQNVTDTVLIKEYPGFNINAIMNYRLSKNLDLRILPGMQFTQRDMTINGAAEPIQLESVYTEMPVLLKYRADRLNNFAPYLIGGINPRYDWAGGAIENLWTNVPRLLKGFDVYPELGFGFDFYFEEVKVAAELKFSVGMLNIFKVDDTDTYTAYNAAIQSLHSRMFILAIHIE